MTITERGRNLLRVARSNSAPALLPVIPTVLSGDENVDRAISAIREHLQVREGERGNDFERTITKRDLVEIGLIGNEALKPKDAQTSDQGPDAVVVRTDGGVFASMQVDDFAERVRNTRTFRDLIRSLDDPERFNGYPDEIKAILLQSIDDVATRLGASITELQEKTQSESQSQAFKLSEITAAVRGVASGLREFGYAFGNANQAQAGKITQLAARLDNFGKDNGYGVASLEDVMRVMANRTDGLLAERFMKVQAGNKIAGIGMTAYEDPNGHGVSDIMMLADRFAFVLPSDDTSSGKAPANRIPFGIDANGLYISSNVYVKTVGGASLPMSVVAENGAVPTTRFIGAYPSQPGACPENSVYRNTTDGNSYIVQGGQWRIFLEKGVRGSRTAYGWAPTWNSGLANDAMATLTGGGQLVIGDTVTLSDAASRYSETRYWSGFGWVPVGMVLDGNLLVNGTVSAAAIGADAIRAEHLSAGSVTARSIAAGSITAESGAIADLAVGTLKLQGESVTVPRALDAYGIWPSMDITMSPGWFQMQVVCLMNFQANTGDQGLRDGRIVVTGMGYTLNQGYSFTSAPAGYSYQLVFVSTFGPLPSGTYNISVVGNMPAGVAIRNVSMTVLGVKR